MKRDTAQAMRVRIVLNKESFVLELRHPHNPAIIPRKVQGPVCLWGPLQLIREKEWFIPDGWDGFGVHYATTQKSLLKAWNDGDIEAYAVDQTTGEVRELFNVET